MEIILFGHSQSIHIMYRPTTSIWWPTKIAAKSKILNKMNFISLILLFKKNLKINSIGLGPRPNWRCPDEH